MPCIAAIASAAAASRTSRSLVLVPAGAALRRRAACRGASAPPRSRSSARSPSLGVLASRRCSPVQRRRGATSSRRPQLARPRSGISWHVGVDGISLCFVAADRDHRSRSPSSARRSGANRSPSRPGCCSSRPACLGSFVSLDVLLVLLVLRADVGAGVLPDRGVGPRAARRYAAMKFFVYTFARLGVPLRRDPGARRLPRQPDAA